MVVNGKSTKERVREAYGRIAEESPCCSEESSERIGYSAEELDSLPTGADQGLGCGNPIGFSAIQTGDTVLDLGSGGGIDCFLAAKRTGPTGKVIGVDFTPAMIEKARENARRGGYSNVEFIFGDIENLPVENDHVDLVISNCVINLTDDKPKVFEEIYRVLKPGGSFIISDIVWLKHKPEWVAREVDTAGCVSGAISKNDYLDAMRTAGFSSIDILKEQTMTPDLVRAEVTREGGNACGCGAGPSRMQESEILDLSSAIASVTFRGKK